MASEMTREKLSDPYLVDLIEEEILSSGGPDGYVQKLNYLHGGNAMMQQFAYNVGGWLVEPGDESDASEILNKLQAGALLGQRVARMAMPDEVVDRMLRSVLPEQPENLEDRDDDTVQGIMLSLTYLAVEEGMAAADPFGKLLEQYGPSFGPSDADPEYVKIGFGVVMAAAVEAADAHDEAVREIQTAEGSRDDMLDTLAAAQTKPDLWDRALAQELGELE